MRRGGRKKAELNLRPLSNEEISLALDKLKDKNKRDLIENVLKRVRVLVDKHCWIINEDWSNYTSISGEVGHRLIFKLFVGDLIGKDYACHKCDRKGCINYEHLFRGNASSNNRDLRFKKETFLFWRKREMLANRASTGTHIDSNKEIKPWHSMFRERHDRFS